MRKFLQLIVTFVLALLFSVSASAQTFDNYTFSNSGEAIADPIAYQAEKELFTCQLGIGNLNTPTDMATDNEGNLYVLDNLNYRIVVLTSQLKLKKVFDCSKLVLGKESVKWNSPQGIYVNNGEIYVCDTENSRILVLDTKTGKLLRTIGAPKDKVLGDEFIYKPMKVATDDHNNLYVVSKGTFEGVLALNPQGEFSTFFASNKVATSAWDLFWRNFSTKKQRKTMLQLVPQDFSSICTDDEGFFFITTSTESNGAMVQRINMGGKNVIRSGGYTQLVGDPNKYHSGTLQGVSSFIDVTSGPYKIYACLDITRNKVFCYDFDGHMIYNFGSKSDQTGGFKNPVAIATLTDDRYAVLDSVTASITVFSPTEYGKAINKGIYYKNELDYDNAFKQWEEVLKYNRHYVLAIDMMGNSYYNNGDYEAAMECFKESGNTSMYSTAKKQARSSFIYSNTWLVILLIAVVIILYFGKKIVLRLKKSR